MTQKQNTGRRNSLSVKMFFLFAALIIIAFLIVALVKTCNREHEEKEAVEEELVNDAYGQLSVETQEEINLLS